MERDDIIEYSLDAHHSEEAGAKIRKKIWFVTTLLTVVTLLEVLLGVYYAQMEWLSWTAVKLIFIGLTVLKAGYIVMVFMHLGDERKSFKVAILLPYILFILYLIFICLTEGSQLHMLDGIFR
ncbi:MAG: cytochrome C oxidase subunit IV family protein [Flavobacteriales bacterium]|nr:cytochrome C oxidase subunit IV family protein [Flavobacteriales bacterium]